MMKKLRHPGDRLSELSESLIHHILSFLPLKDVVSTTILSKRWKNLWTTAPCLNLIIEDEDENSGTEDEDSGTEDEDSGTEDEEDRTKKRTERLLKFVNRALILWKGVKILKFKIDIKSEYNCVSDVNVWTRFAVNNQVEELEIITNGEHFAPQCLDSCSSLTKLSLVCSNVEMLKSPSWNQLKSLRLDVFRGSPISGDLIDQILLGSPQLEVFELQLENNNEDLNISSTSLKKLKIGNRLYLEEDINLMTLRICCPHLETLDISGLFGKCLFSETSSLIDITLHIHTFDWSARSNELLGENLKHIFSSIQHAEIVALSDLCVKVFGASRKKYLHSQLPNVKFLKLDLSHIKSGEMMDLLGIFPNVKMLVIKDEAPSPTKSQDSDVVNYLESNLLLELKTVEISSSFRDFSVFWLIEFLLKHAVKLEKMVIRLKGFRSYQQKKLFEISEKLLSMQRSSLTTKVILKKDDSDSEE